MLGRGFCLTCHRSYPACIRTQLSAVGTLIQASRRIAISALTPARPLTTRDRATRDTPSCAAASVTPIPSSGSTSSFKMLPGWGVEHVHDGHLFSDSLNNRPILHFRLQMQRLAANCRLLLLPNARQVRLLVGAISSQLHPFHAEFWRHEAIIIACLASPHVPLQCQLLILFQKTVVVLITI